MGIVISKELTTIEGKTLRKSGAFTDDLKTAVLDLSKLKIVFDEKNVYIHDLDIQSKWSVIYLGNNIQNEGYVTFSYREFMSEINFLNKELYGKLRMNLPFTPDFIAIAKNCCTKVDDYHH